ncbi:MAG: RNase adapter RapZ [Deltaproteobacteria bacterium]|nr:RNase adapter RapZ [Deltaproteobacteria bacterium]
MAGFSADREPGAATAPRPEQQVIQEPTDALYIVVICGLSGAGKSVASDALEDHGFFCVDNLPVSLLAPLVDFSLASGGRLQRLALVATVRSADETQALTAALTRLADAGHRVELMFLDAATEILVRRYSETRRRHPLDDQCPDLRSAIARERELLAPLRPLARHDIDSSDLRAGELRSRVLEHLSHPATGMLVAVGSFGFKHGTPRNANLVLDARFLPNPFFVDELRERSGEDAAVARYVLAAPEAETFLQRIEGLLDAMLPLHAAAGNSYLSVAIGCTGGRHRSVALAAELESRLRRRGIATRLHHRDINKR